MLIATAAEMRALDLEAITDLGIPGAVLMEAAGRGAADAIAAALAGRVRGVRVGILCGAGNNGGDGYVIARHLSGRGADVRVYQCAPRSREPAPGDDGALNLSILKRLGGVPVLDCTSEGKLDEHRATLAAEDVLVDALLGTGATRNVSGVIARAIALANQSAPRLRVAVDLPTGLDADTGAVLGEAFAADLTTTFGVPKLGLVGWPGCERAGRLVTIDIGIPPQVVERRLRARFLDARDVAALVPPRPLGGHKGTFGHVLVIAGGPGRTGAALLAARGAQRAGAGLVTIAAPPESRASLEPRVLEAMTAALPDDAAGMSALVEDKRAVVYGPGAGLGATTSRILQHLVGSTPLPLVLDADAITTIASDQACREAVVSAHGRVALTPHPGEAARLLGTGTAEVQHDRVGSALRLARELGAAVALKGARTVIADPDGQLAINSTGNPALATGGTGDVLGGVTGALLARGLRPFDALCVAAYVHGAAADALARAGNPQGLLAGEVADAIPASFVTLLSESAGG